MSIRYELEAPKLIEKAYGENYGLCRIPGMVITERGTLLCYYEGRENFSDWAKIDIKVIRSGDGGESFEDVLCIEGGEDTLNNPVMIADGDTIHFLFCKNYRQLFYSKSADDGKSFSEPVEITHIIDDDGTPCTVIATGPGHGIVHLGRVIVPMWFVYNPEDPKAHSPARVRTLYSEDKGETWRLGEIIDNGPLTSPNESTIALTREGNVLISMRSQLKEPPRCRALATSPDGISGWSTPKFCEALTDARCMGSMTHDGRYVYHINCTKEDAREDLTVKVSDNNFDSYDSIFVSKYAGYSDIARGKDCLYIFYERFHEKFHAKWNPNIKTVPDPEDGLYFAKINILEQGD